jgi:hypothetical protein
VKKCIKTLRYWLVTKGGYSWAQSTLSLDTMRPWLREIKPEYTLNSRKKNQKIWILCGTEAISTGLNVSDILQVVQVGMVRDGNINILLRCLGRGGRKGQKLLGIFFIKVGERSERQTATRRSKAARRKSVRGMITIIPNSEQLNNNMVLYLHL